MRRFSHSRARAFALAVAFVLLAPQVALAHLALRRSTPADGAHVAVAVRMLRLEFTEAVEVAVSRLRLIGPSGAEVPISPLWQPGDSAHIVLADVAGPLEGGVYRLEWQVVGKDGHPVRGTISYVVAPGATGLDDPARADPPPVGKAGASVTAPGQEASHHDPTSIPSGEGFGAESLGYVVVRALQFMTLLMVIGALTFDFVVLRLLRRTETDPDIVTSMRRHAARLGFWAAVALLVVAILRLYAQSLAMHGPGQALDSGIIASMISATVWGWGWLIQAAGALVAIAGFAMAQRGRASGWALGAVAGIALAIAPALSGHAVATPGFAAQAVAADALHVIGAAGWLGSLLFVLVVGIPVAMRLGSDRRGGAVARLVNAFSPTALLFAGLAALTGIFAAWLHIGFSSALWTSDYGRIVLIKVAILSAALGTGAYNWLRVKPSLGDEKGAQRVQRSATAELIVGVLVVIVTAVLVATPPPMDMNGGANTAGDPACLRDDGRSNSGDRAAEVPQQLSPARNQQRVTGDVLKKSSSILPTLPTPDGDGCVPSLERSVVAQTSPSERGITPRPQRYGPQATQGATVR